MIQYGSGQLAPAPQFARPQTETPYNIPGAHADVYGMLNDRNSAEMAARRSQTNEQFANSQMKAQQEAALAGLQNMSQARSNASDISNRRRSANLGMVNSLLSGLFG